MNNANKVAVTVKEQGKETQDMIIPPDVSVESVFRDCSVTMLRGDTTRKELNPKQTFESQGILWGDILELNRSDCEKGAGQHAE